MAVHQINISDDFLQEILSEIGYPLVSLQDLGELAGTVAEDGQVDENLVLDNLKQIIIWPSIREYYKWFPIPNIVEYMAEDSFSIDFPDPETFTVMDCRLNTAGFGVRDSVNPFVNNSVYRAINTTSSYGGGMWGTRYDYDYRSARLYDRMERASLISMNKAFRVDVDEQNRKLVGFSNIMGKLVVSWGKYSEDFNKIPFRRVDEVIKLCKARLLFYLGNIRGSQTANLPNSFNYQLLLDRAKVLEDSVINKWKKFTKLGIIVG